MLKSKLSKLLSRRRPASHKGDYGRVLVVAGSVGMTGAAVLASRGALRCGAGLTYLAVPRELVSIVDSMTPEVITLPFEKIRDIKADVVALGPGLGAAPRTRKLTSSLLSHPTPLVIDADGLNVIAKHPELLGKGKAEDKVILTPHPGEMSRLLNESVERIQKDRVAAAKKAAKKFGCIVVLKGHGTVVADPGEKIFINTTGNPGMASGGVGDVLTGMIAAFVAQGTAFFDAAVFAVHLHGLAGDLAAKELGEYGMIASDLVEKIPYAIQRIS